MYKHILLPTDGSALSERAVASGIRLAQALGARVSALHVTPSEFSALDDWAHGGKKASLRLRRIFDDKATRYLDGIDKAAREAGVRCQCLRASADNPYQAILRTARRRGCDLIFMAAHGRRGASALILGSEAIKVLTHSTIPVVIHRESNL